MKETEVHGEGLVSTNAVVGLETNWWIRLKAEVA